MSYVREIALHNWMSFAGSQVVQLNPTIYAVTASRVEDPGRSNFVGKSAFLEAVPFALFGDHRHRTEDEWITTGADAGGVGLVLSEGSVVRRERKRGGKTKLTVVGCDGKRCSDREAQERIDEIVGMGKEDFYRLCFVKQKELDALVRASPEEFASVIGSWIQLSPLEEVEDEACKMLAQCSAKLAELDASIRVWAVDALGSYEPGVDLESEIRKASREAEAGRLEAEGCVSSCTAKLKAARASLAVCSAWYSHENARNAVAVNVAKLEEVTALLARESLPELEAALEDAEAALDVAGSEHRSCEERHRKVVDLARGHFDGKCPVTQEACPAAEAILKRGVKLKSKLVGSQAGVDRVAAVHNSVRSVRNAARDRLDSYRGLEARKAALASSLSWVAEHARYLREHPKPSDPAAFTVAVEEAEAALLEAKASLAECESKVARLGARADAIRKAVANKGDLRQSIARYQRVRRAAGRQGAQRDVSVASMRQVERLGNALLGDGNTGLSFSVRWTIEGKKLARSCDCGYEYTGQRDRECPRCKAERGMQALDRPGLTLSDRSGAAEDLVGAAVRLGASAWLRRRRGIGWSAAFIDEAFGALDSTLRDSFARYLTTTLGSRYGFAQSFVISHTDDVNSCMPGQVRIVGGPFGSRVEVAE